MVYGYDRDGKIISKTQNEHGHPFDHAKLAWETQGLVGALEVEYVTFDTSFKKGDRSSYGPFFFVDVNGNVSPRDNLSPHFDTVEAMIDGIKGSSEIADEQQNVI